MNVALNYDDLLGALDQLKLTCGIPQTPVLALTCVYLEASHNRLSLRSTDLRQRLEMEIPATVLEDGECLLPLRRLAQAVSSLKDSVVIKSSGQGVQIVSGTTRLKLKEVPFDEFPKALPLDDSVQAILPCAQLLQLLKVAFCISTKDDRPSLRGACLESAEGKVLAVGSDGLRLAVHVSPGPEGCPAFSVIIPQESVATLLRIMPREGNVTLLIQPRHLAIMAPTINYRTDLIEGPYPPWRKIFPQREGHPVIFQRAAMLDALARVAGAHDGESRGRVELTVKVNRIQVRLDGGVEELGEDEVPSRGGESGRRVLFDLDYLTQGIKNATGEEISFYPAGEESRPGLFADTDYSYALASMRKPD